MNNKVEMFNRYKTQPQVNFGAVFFGCAVHGFAYAGRLFNVGCTIVDGHLCYSPVLLLRLAAAISTL